MSSRKKTRPLPANRRPAARPGAKRKIGWPIIAGGMAAVAAAVGILLVIVLTLGSDATSGNELAKKIDDSAQSLPQQSGFEIGSASAPLVLEVYEDLQCPFCVKFTAEIEPTLIDEYVAFGKLRLVFRNFPILGNESAAAAESVVCASAQNRTWNYVLELYSRQAAAGQVDNEKLNVGRFDSAKLREAAGEARLNLQEYDACLKAGEATATVAAQHDTGAALGVRGTPSFVLNGTYLEDPPADAQAWRDLLNERLAK